MDFNEAVASLQRHEYPSDRLSQLGHHITDMLRSGGPLSDILAEADRLLEEDEGTQAVEIVVHLNDSDLQSQEPNKSTVIDLKRVPDGDGQQYQETSSAQTPPSGRPLRKRTIKIRLEKDIETRHRKDSAHFEDPSQLSRGDAGQSDNVGISSSGSGKSRTQTQNEMWSEFMAAHRRLMDGQHQLRQENARLIEDYNRRSAELFAEGL